MPRSGRSSAYRPAPSARGATPRWCSCAASSERSIMAESELPVLEPPPGGLARLRERIAADDRRVRWWRLAIPAVLAAAAIVAWLAIGAPEQPPPAAPLALVADPAIAPANDVTF